MLSILWLVLGTFPLELRAAGPTLQHQPPTGLQHGTPGATVKPDGKGGTTISKTTTSTETSADGKTTTKTTTDQSKTTNKDGSTVDKTETKTESTTTAKGPDGKDYTQSKTTTNVATTRTTNKKGETSTASTSGGHQINYKEPNADGETVVDSSTVFPPEKLENGATGIVKKTYRDDDNNVVVETTIPGHVKSTKTDYGGGREQIVLEYPDGHFLVMNFDGGTKTVEHYDKDKELVQTDKTDKKGNKTSTYQRNGSDVTEVTGKDGKPISKTVREQNGTSYEIQYDKKGKPKKIIQYDENGKKTREEDLGPEDQKDFEKNFGDGLGMGEFPGGAGVGRDVLVGLDSPNTPAAEEHFEV